MADEFQPYFYLSKKDLNSPNNGKMVGYLLLLGTVAIFFLKLVGAIKISWGAFIILLGISIISIFLGKTIHEKPKQEPRTSQREMLHSR